MADESLTKLLGEALRDLVIFVERRPDDATADDDVRALEEVTHRLSRATPADVERLTSLLGDEVVSILGLG